MLEVIGDFTQVEITALYAKSELILEVIRDGTKRGFHVIAHGDLRSCIEALKKDDGLAQSMQGATGGLAWVLTDVDGSIGREYDALHKAVENSMEYIKNK